MKKVLILGLGHVGKALAARLRKSGIRVAGTTTTQSKVKELSEFADEVYVLRGTEADAISGAAAGCDAIITTVAPNIRKAKTREEREDTYREALVSSCENAVAVNPRVVFLSSFSVYGDGGPGNDPIIEQNPVSNRIEPSARFYSQAEQVVLSKQQGCVLRLPDIYGAPGDMSYEQRVKLAHEILGGKGPFSGDALLYIIHYLDVVLAVEHVLQKNLTGTYNVCVGDVIPKTNSEVFNTLSQRMGVPNLEFLGQIKAPTRQISAHKIYSTGFIPVHTDPDHPLR